MLSQLVLWPGVIDSLDRFAFLRAVMRIRWVEDLCGLLAIGCIFLALMLPLFGLALSFHALTSRKPHRKTATLGLILNAVQWAAMALWLRTILRMLDA